MSVESALPLDRNIFERALDVLSNPAELVEGVFWGIFLALDALFLRCSIVDWNKKSNLPDTDPKKIDQVWRAKKDSLLIATSLASSSCMALDWLNRTGIIALGFFGPYTGGIGYGGRGLFSLIHLQETGGDFIEKNSLYRKSHNTGERKELLKEQIRLLVKIAMQVLMAAWGIFGMLNIFIGASFLFYVSDTAFLCWLLLFPAYIGAETVLRKKSKEIELPKSNEKPLQVAHAIKV